MSEDLPSLEQRFTAKPAPSAYIILCIVAGSPAIGAIVMSVIDYHSMTSWWKALVLGAAIDCIIVIWLNAFYVKVENGQLIYNSLVGGVHRVDLNEIKKVKTVLDFNILQYPRRPTHRLEIYTKSSGKNPLCNINIKVFRARDIQYLNQLLNRLIR